MTNRRTPSPEDFARAKKQMREITRNMEQIRQGVKSQGLKYGVKECFALYSKPTSTATTYIFLPNHQDVVTISETEANDLKSIVDALFKLYRPDIEHIEVEFDSEENVKKNYNGNYFDRLR